MWSGLLISQKMWSMAFYMVVFMECYNLRIIHDIPIRVQSNVAYPFIRFYALWTQPVPFQVVFPYRFTYFRLHRVKRWLVVHPLIVFYCHVPIYSAPRIDIFPTISKMATTISCGIKQQIKRRIQGQKKSKQGGYVSTVFPSAVQAVGQEAQKYIIKGN